MSLRFDIASSIWSLMSCTTFIEVIPTHISKKIQIEIPILITRIHRTVVLIYLLKTLETELVSAEVADGSFVNFDWDTSIPEPMSFLLLCM
jgi:hypothetical protein